MTEVRTCFEFDLGTDTQGQAPPLSLKLGVEGIYVYCTPLKKMGSWYRNTNVRCELRTVSVLKWRNFELRPWHWESRSRAATVFLGWCGGQFCVVYTGEQKIRICSRNTNVRWELRTVIGAKMTELQTLTLALTVKVTWRRYGSWLVRSMFVCSVYWWKKTGRRSRPSPVIEVLRMLVVIWCWRLGANLTHVITEIFLYSWRALWQRL